jgi:hypothetical protein
VARNQDVHTSNMLVFDWLRATLHQIPKEQRPDVAWVIYGVDVKLDDDLRGSYWPPESDLATRPLEIILGWRDAQPKPTTN